MPPDGHLPGSEDGRRPPAFWPVYVRHGLPCAAVWSIHLLAFWPGILTEDSIEQWTDMTSGVIRGYHSPLQTVLHWLLTRVWDSPAIIVLAQIAVLSGAYAAVVKECTARQASRWLPAATTLVVAALPANGFLVITLWKDVPYTIALLWVAALTLRLSRTGGRFAGRWDVLGMATAMTAAATFRHNGLPTIAIFLLLLIWIVPAPRRSAWQLAALTFAGVVAIHFGLFRMVGVQSYHPAYRDQTILHQVAAAMRPGTAYDQSDLASLRRIMPIDDWVRTYRCESVIPTLASVLAHNGASQYAVERGSLRLAWWHALARSPRILLAHHACVTGVIWNPAANFFLVSTDIVPNGHGLRTVPVLPGINRTLVDWLQATSRLEWRAIVWGPALHLLLIMNGVVWMAARRPDPLHVVALLLPLLHSAVLLIFIPSAEYRLQYPVVLFGLLTPLMVASARNR